MTTVTPLHFCVWTPVTAVTPLHFCCLTPVTAVTPLQKCVWRESSRQIASISGCDGVLTCWILVAYEGCGPWPPAHCHLVKGGEAAEGSGWARSTENRSSAPSRYHWRLGGPDLKLFWTPSVFAPTVRTRREGEQFLLFHTGSVQLHEKHQIYHPCG